MVTQSDTSKTVPQVDDSKSSSTEKFEKNGMEWNWIFFQKEINSCFKSSTYLL